MKKVKMVLAVLVCSLFVSTMTFADSGAAGNNEGLMKMVKELQDQVKGLQDELAQTKAKEPAMPKGVEDQMNALQKELAALKAQQPATPQIATSAGEVPAWLAGTTFGGDLLVRFQMQSNNSTKDSNRARLRLRYKFTKQLNEQMMFAMKFATGNTANRRDSIVNLGRGTNDGFDKLDIWLDEAYIKYTPEQIENLTIWAGKFANNWKEKEFLLHPDGCGFDGIGESYMYELNENVKFNLDFAQLVVSEAAAADSDSELFVFSGAVSGKISDTSVTWGLRGTNYLFAGFRHGGDSAIGTTNSASMQNPNVFVGTADLGFTVADLPVSLWAQGGVNATGDNVDAADVENQNMYYGLGAWLNKLKNPGDWTIGYKYAYMETNAFPSGLVDADLGVGNSMHVVCAQYRWLASTDLGVDFLMPRPLAGDKDSETMIVKMNVVTRF